MKTHAFNLQPSRRGLLVTGALLAVAVAPVARANYYAGTAVCAECHGTKVATLSQSIHSKMIRPGANTAGVIHGDLSKPNAPTLNGAGQTGVDWVMGGWYKEESYIRVGRPEDPYPYTVTQFQWDPIKGTYSNTQTLRDWTVKCAGCHTTGYVPGKDALQQPTGTWKELNIGCEACHGPGGDHADNGGDSIFPVIDRTVEACGRCHIRAESEATAEFAAKAFNFPIGYVAGQPSSLKFIPEPLSATASFFPDGTSNRHRQTYLDMNYPGRTPTGHYTSGISCTKCHDPHTAGTLAVYPGALPAGSSGIKVYNIVPPSSTASVAWESGANLWHPITHAPISKEALCKTCHPTVSDHHVHQFNATALAASVTCVDCHMPDIINVDPITLRGALAPHRFNAMMPANSLKFGAAAQPNTCTYRCHQDTGADKNARALWADSIITLKAAPVVTSSHVLNLNVVGTPGYSYDVEASTNLTDWQKVTTKITAPLPGNAPRWGFTFEDAASAGMSKRFYRVRPTP